MYFYKKKAYYESKLKLSAYSVIFIMLITTNMPF